QIKYPSAPAWSPDGKTVAFLWDAWGKQDLFVAPVLSERQRVEGIPGQKPVALTDFPVDPDILTSDIAAFAWVSSNEILFSRNGALWTVSPANSRQLQAVGSSAKPARVSGGLADAANFTLSNDRKLIAFTRGGQIWI